MNDQIVFEEIVLRQAPLRIKHAKIPIGHVSFDQDNPRLRYLKDINPTMTDAELLLRDPDTAWLVKDIKDKGVIDPIYVKRDLSNSDAHFIAVEGNRRTAVVGHLHNQDSTNPRFQTIPAKLLPDQISEEEIALLMASFHVAGKLKWDPHERAGHIYQMLHKLHIPKEELQNTLHMAGPTIARIAESYRILEEVFKRIDGGAYSDKADGKWSFFAEMLKVKSLKDKHYTDTTWAETFARWVGESRIPKAENVRDLPDILAKSRARNIFENETPSPENFEKALKEARVSNPAKNSKFYKHIESVIEACRVAQWVDMQQASENEQARQLLIEAYQAIGAFIERAGIRIPPRRVA